jgi:hypothetical protein
MNPWRPLASHYGEGLGETAEKETAGKQTQPTASGETILGISR